MVKTGNPHNNNPKTIVILGIETLPPKKLVRTFGRIQAKQLTLEIR
jgi:hypothetical protein